MARPRRLRHKLMLGLALVVGSVALLLGGTLYGVQSYFASMRTGERKLTEMKYVTAMIKSLEAAEQPSQDSLLRHEYDRLRGFAEDCRAKILHYQTSKDFLAGTVAAGLDPDDGYQETELSKKLHAELGALIDALDAAVRGSGANSEPSASLHQNPEVKEHLAKSRTVADQLRFALFDDIERSSRTANVGIRQGLWIVLSAAVLAVVLTLALMHYARAWVFRPLKELQAGVQRVHGGDFDHPIMLRSKDELEDLATEFNAMTTRLSATYKDLARQVNERSRQLVRSERMVSVGFLAAGVAHEINNPLASILFCAEALERRLQDVLTATRNAPGVSPGDAEVLARYLKMIQQEALRCKDITQKLLDFSRSGERKREPTDLAGLVRGVLEVARHLPNCRGKNITFDPTGYVTAPVNGQDLKSVILNLVVNALDSMDDGGGIAIHLGTTPDHAELTFTDTGCGMTPEVLENIFEPFFTKSRTGKGTGLGLFISHQIIDQHGGVIQAASGGPGKGSTFVVRLPLREAAPADGSDTAAPPVLLQFPGARAAA